MTLSSPRNSSHDKWNTLKAALAAGIPALAANTLMLEAGRRLGVETGRGGLLQWLHAMSGSQASEWSGTAALAFHLAVGLLMAMLYAFAVEPVLRRRTRAVQGLLYAAATWLINAAVVLPGLGEGFAGYRHIDVLGMAYFACAHILFFAMLVLLYRRPAPARGKE